jgi:parallel beta-helix repeat protein
MAKRLMDDLPVSMALLFSGYAERGETMRRKTLFLGVVGLLIFLAIGNVFAATPLPGTCGMNITTPGSYVLQDDILNCSTTSGPNAAITVTADDVELDLNGHTLSGGKTVDCKTASCSGYGVFINGASNVTIKNGTITSFCEGILFLKGRDYTRERSLRNITIVDNRILNNGRGLYGNRTGTLRHLRVADNEISGNCWGAIVLFNAWGVEIKDNIICNNGKYGVSLTGSKWAEIIHNSFVNNTNGVVFYSNSNNNAIYGNAFCHNYNGILVYSGKNNKFIQNSLLESKNIQAHNAGKNTWGGNFWSDHTNCPNPYIINEATGVQDRHPLCSPVSWVAPCSCDFFAQSVCGYKFHDLNGDGSWGDNEPGLAGWTINLEGFNLEGDVVKASTTTGAGGSYCFESLPPGSYTVKESHQEGWDQTFPGGDGSHSIHLLNGNEKRCVNYNFGNVAVAQATGSICGYKFNDRNGSGTWDTGEPGLAGWTINLVGDVNASTTTGADGSYCFESLPPGSYTVRETQQSGWRQTFPDGDGSHSIHLLNAKEKRCVSYNFGNVAVAQATGSICGYKFNDRNGNGTWDKGEPGLAGWTINLVGDVNASTTTGADGSYCFESLPPGSYTVRETQQSGWRQTFPGGDGSHSIHLLNANELRCVNYNFGNVAVAPAPATGSICGYKFNDRNGNGTWDTGEPGLAGWTISLVGIVNASATTGADGSYCFESLPSGSYTVSEIQQVGWVQTFPLGGSYSIDLANGLNGDNRTSINFGNVATGSICGYKFNDRNGNGTWNPEEPGLAGWTINLAGPVNASRITGAEGSYCFESLPPGSYTVTETSQPFWIQTFPGGTGSHSIDLVDGEDRTSINFGNVMLQ